MRVPLSAVICLSGAVALASVVRSAGVGSPVTAALLGIRFVPGSTSTLIVERDGHDYLVDLAAKSVTEQAQAEPPKSGASDGASIFKQHCATCHGADGKGIKTVGTPDFTDPKTLANVSETAVMETIQRGKGRMPAWSGKLSDSDIHAVAKYVRSLSSRANATPEGQGTSKVYTAGDDVLITLPTGRPLAEHGLYVNFTHRFAFDPIFSGPARGGDLFGLDGFALASFGFGYGVTKHFSVDVYRSPTFIGRPIQLMAAYNIWDEHDGHPFNVAARFSVQGLNDFSREFTENFEGIISRSIASRAEVYVVPTFSVNTRRLFTPISVRSVDIPALPGFNSFVLGIGTSVDIRPTVALLAEVDPTLVNGEELGIHRPAFAFGIQKKILRHAFTLGITNSPGTTVSQRSGTLAAYRGMPGADKFSGLILAFDLTRQIR